MLTQTVQPKKTPIKRDTADINAVIIGTGLIGRKLLDLIALQKQIRVIAILNSKKMIFNQSGILIQGWETLLNNIGEPSDIEDIMRKVGSKKYPKTVFVDCTSSDDVVSFYRAIFASGCSIVTPNKKANSSPYSVYKSLHQTAKNNNVNFFYETNVGAGLPIIGQIQKMVKCGEKITKIEGVLSGTLSYIFNSFLGDKKFSGTVMLAKEKGYTEPDPREDLNGMDVARKLLILGRTAGLPLELYDIEVENLIPAGCEKAEPVTAFFEELKKHDGYFEEKKQNALKNEKALRYVASLENGRARVSLQEVGNRHPFYWLSGSDNCISIHTNTYFETPLLIQGPGAGADVTAAGVLADIFKL